MVPSYQTVPLANVPKANAPKDERSLTPVPRMKKVAVATLVGMALVVVGYAYGSSTIHPARMTDIALTTAANLVRGGVSKNQKCFNGPCNDHDGDEEACKKQEECYWFKDVHMKILFKDICSICNTRVNP